jgi:enoyl-CoA hydratase
MTALRIDTENGVTVITIDRPPVNALDMAACSELAATFKSFADMAQTRCVIVTGAGTRAFCAGLDFQAFFDPAGSDDERNALLRDLYASIYSCPVPVIAAVERPAIGAGSVIASVCDIRVAARSATFSLPEINVGRIGGAAYHQRLLPQGALRRMAFTGSPLTAEEGHRLGFVDELVSADALAAAMGIAAVIATKSPLVARQTKQSLNEIEVLDPATGYQREQQRNAVVRQSEDAGEAIRAVREKRKPAFKGR